MSNVGEKMGLVDTIVQDFKTIGGAPVLWPLAFLVFISGFTSFISLRAHGSMVPICFFFTLALFAFYYRSFPKPSPALTLVWALFVALVGVAMLRSLDVDYAIGRFSKLFMMSSIALLFWSLSNKIPTLPALRPLLVIAFLIGLFICLVEGLSDGLIFWLTHNVSRIEAMHTANRPVVLVVLFAWPVALALSQLVDQKFVLLLVFLTVAASFTTESQSAQLGGVVAALVLVSSKYFPRVVLWAVGAGGVLAIVAMPSLLGAADWTRIGGTSLASTQTILPRLELWQFVAQKIMEKPLLGYGLEAGRFLPLDGMAHQYFGGTRMHHPHNGIMQVWFEMGLLGAVLLALAWGALVYQIGRLGRLSQRYVLAGLTCILVICSVSHGLWQTWWVSALVMMPFFYAISSGGDRAGTDVV